MPTTARPSKTSAGSSSLTAQVSVIGSDQITLEPVTFTWAVNELLPALVLLGLAVVGIYWTIISRNKEVKA